MSFRGSSAGRDSETLAGGEVTDGGQRKRKRKAGRCTNMETGAHTHTYISPSEWLNYIMALARKHSC